MQCVAQTEKGVELIHPLMFEEVYRYIKNLTKIEGIIFVNEGSFLIVPIRDYETANRNYNSKSVELEISNPMSYRFLRLI